MPYPTEDTGAHAEKIYKYLVEHSLGLMCSHDFEGRLLTINTAAVRGLGYDDPGALVGRNLRDLVPRELHARVGMYLDRVRRNGYARGYLTLRRHDGALVTWYYRNSVFQEPGEAPIVLGHAQDVTDRLATERALKDTKEQYRALFEDAPVAYHEIDQRGIITRVNRAECELLRRTKEQLIGLPVWELVAPEQRDASRYHVGRKLLGLQPLVPFLREYQRRDGSRVAVNIHEKLIRSASGEILGIRSALLDVTEQKRVEAELRSLNASLDVRVAERTEELNASNERLKEFVYTVSHDLQEPLRSISSFAALLRNRYRDSLDSDGVEFLEYVISGATRMSTLIRHLLAYSRVLHEDRVAFELVNLGTVVELVKDDLSTSIEASGAVVTCDELPTVWANPVRMAQLLQNLFSNSIKYRSDEPPRIDVSCTSNSEDWTICVSDNGIGVPAGDVERIFGLFKRARGTRVEAGSGVGLAICRAIVERHGGHIWVEPAEPRGSRFRFTLPVHAASETARA